MEHNRGSRPGGGGPEGLPEDMVVQWSPKEREGAPSRREGIFTPRQSSAKGPRAGEECVLFPDGGTHWLRSQPSAWCDVQLCHLLFNLSLLICKRG